MRWILILLLLLSTKLLAQPPDFKFRHITTEDGLSHSNVKTILQDHRGYMWFGTADGLNKYDGHNIVVYKHQVDDTTSLSSSDIIKIFEDSKHILWIGTRYGLNRYDRKLDKFIRHDEVSGNIISNIVEDKQQCIWITSGPHIYKFDSLKNQFIQCSYTWLGNNIQKFYFDKRDTVWVTMPDDNKVYNYNCKDQAYVPRIWDEINEVVIPVAVMEPGKVLDVFEDNNGVLWMASYGKGLLSYDLENKKSQLYRHEKGNPFSLWNNNVISIAEDAQNRLWVGTQNGGISIYDKNNHVFYNFSTEHGNPKSLNNNSINVIYQDHDQNMWIGTYSGGVSLATVPKFSHYYNIHQNKNSLSSNVITSFCELNDSTILIGTDGGGTNVFNINQKKFSILNLQNSLPQNISLDYVSSILKDKNEKIWISYWQGGFGCYEPKKNINKHYLKSSSNLPDDNVMYLYEDKDGELWVATLNGLYLFEEKNSKFTHYSLGIGLENYVLDIHQDNEHNLWIGTWEGLKLLDKKTKKYETYLYSHLNRKSLSNNKVNVIHEDHKGRIWIGTAGGLNLLDKKNKQFFHFFVTDGLPSDAVYGILEDGSGDLWLSTGNGISRFNPEMQDFKNYDTSDGLQGREFREHAFIKLTNGQMLFGGTSGFNIFHPDKIWQNITLPTVVFTDFKIFNKSVEIGTEESPLQQHISETSKIKLPYKSTVFSIEFSALNFISPENVQYEYLLEGFDKNWINSGNNRTVTYTNLDPGQYTFKVTASNHDGFWNMEGASLAIIITPPYYKTWWFRILASLMVIGTVIFWVKYRLTSIEQQRKTLERLVDERTQELAIKSQRLLDANKEITLQGRRIQSLYNDMKDSIRAAKVIQQSIIESGKTLDGHFTDYFVFNQPKDVVGGDFLWFDEINGKKILAAIDCTGHGVSGAFMTLIGYQVLSQIINEEEWETASDILTMLNQNFTYKIKDKEEIQWNNGMDLALIIVDEKKERLQFAGAKNPLYLVRKKELIQFKGDNTSIGVAGYGKPSGFTNQTISIFENDILYLFSDGYVDQFGGHNGKQKFMYPAFRKLLVEISELPMEDQNNQLKDVIRNWQGDLEQIDDILVVGIKI